MAHGKPRGGPGRSRRPLDVLATVAGTLQTGEYSLASGALPPGLVAQPAPGTRVYLPLIISEP